MKPWYQILEYRNTGNMILPPIAMMIILGTQLTQL